jgi:hypothetical protein
MRRVATALLLVIALAAPAAGARQRGGDEHQTRRERIVEKALERDEWGRSDRVVRTTIVVARHLVHKRGWPYSEFVCLKELWSGESGWRWWIYGGVPQAMPERKMASAGADWETNPITQVRWGLGYIADRYQRPSGTGCSPPY